MYMYITIITTFLYIPRFRFFISKYFHSLSCLYLQRLSISTVCVLNHSSSYDYPNYTPVLYILVKQCQCCLYLTLILLLLIKCKGTEEERARPFRCYLHMSVHVNENVNGKDDKLHLDL